MLSTSNYFSNNVYLVGLQETRFTRMQSFDRFKYLWRTASRINSSFWSQDNMTSFTGLAGVGLLITPTCSIRDLHDVTSRYVSSALLLFRYVLVAGTLDSICTYIHIIYAPASPEHRPQFFSVLPRHFEDDALHISVGDFNTVLVTQLDQARSTNPARLQGRDELLSWVSALRLVDPWRLHHPDVQSSPV